MNNSTFQNAGCAIIIESSEEKALKTMAYCCMLLLSLIGNSLVILVVYKNHSMHTTVNYLIVNMAVSDLLQSSIAIPTNIVRIYHGQIRWFIAGKAGDFFCKCVPFLTDISTAVSILSLVIIAFDRFLGVVFPMRASSISKRMHSLNMALTWIIAMAFHAPYFFAFRRIEFNNKTYCTYSWAPLPVEAARTYFLVTSISLFLFPLALLIILYSTILVKLTRRKTPGNSSFRTQQRIARRNRNVLRMVFAVVVLFAMCWLPINTYAYLAYFWALKEQSCFIEFFFWGKFVAYSNTALTPFLYFLFSQNYRQGLKCLFCGKMAQIKTSIQTRPRNEEGRVTSVSGSRRWSKQDMNLKSPQSTSFGDNQSNCIPRFTFR